jgi:hypothetical protein
MRSGPASELLLGDLATKMCQRGKEIAALLQSSGGVARFSVFGRMCRAVGPVVETAGAPHPRQGPDRAHPVGEGRDEAEIKPHRRRRTSLIGLAPAAVSNPAGGPPQCRAGVHHNHIFELFRRLAEAAAQRRKPQPTQTVYAPGSMEWFAAKNKAG